jgi:hypothetical protein
MSVFQAIRAKVEQQLRALNAEEYRITLQNDNEGFIFCKKLLKAEEILEEKKLFILDKKNMIKKMNIYITPISERYDYYLIDDVLEEELQEIKAKYNICCLIQSSYKNFQVILKTEYLDIPDKVKNEYLKQLNKWYGDEKIAGYPHSFRLVGFKNVKEKYLDKQTGHYPIVNLVFSKNETCKTSKSSILAMFNNSEYKSTPQDANSQYKRFCEVIEANNLSISELLNTANNFYEKMLERYGEQIDYSRADFSLLKMLVNNNVDIDIAINVVRQCSPNLSERHRNVEQYLQITKANLLASSQQRS